MFDFRFLLHNILFHPLAGFCWFLGFEDLGDRIHDYLDIIDE